MKCVLRKRDFIALVKEVETVANNYDISTVYCVTKGVQLVDGHMRNVNGRPYQGIFHPPVEDEMGVASYRNIADMDCYSKRKGNSFGHQRTQARQSR